MSPIAPSGDPPPFTYTILRQEVELDINFREKSIKGRTEITIQPLRDSQTTLEEVAIDARQSIIDVSNITVQTARSGTFGPSRKASARYLDPYRLLDYPKLYRWSAEHHDIRSLRMRPLMKSRLHDVEAEDREKHGCTPVEGALRIRLKEDESLVLQKRPTLKIRHSMMAPEKAEDVEIQYKISIPFETKDMKDGLQFVGLDEGDLRYPHAYTRHSFEPGVACCIFPCLDDHGARCDWKISIKCPRTLGDALRQPLATQPVTKGHTEKSQARTGNPAPEAPSRDSGLSEEDRLLEMTVVCSGLLVDEKEDSDDDHKRIMVFESEKKCSVQKIGFAVGPFEHVDLWSEFRTEEDDERLGAKALKIHGYCLPGRADEVRNTCAAMAMASDYFSFAFSGYPFGSYKLCFVEDLIDDVVPLYSLSFVSNRLLYPEDIIDTEMDVMRKLVYTLASQWSGVNIIASTRRDLWVVIGIAYWMTDLFMKKICGNNDHRFRIKVAADKLIDLDVDRPSIYELGHYLHLDDFETEFMYLKAPLVLFILDKRIVKASGGSSSLARILARLFMRATVGSQGSDTTISTDGFRKLCEKLSRLKLEPFWNQWVYGAGCPTLEVTPKFNKKRLCVEMTIRQVQESLAEEPRYLDKSSFLRAILEAQNQVELGPLQPMFSGPLTIRIHEADGTPYEHIVEIREDTAVKRASRFEIPYNTKYKRLKRTRRQKERQQAGGAGDANAENQEDVLLYCFGDSLQGPGDAELFMLKEWDELTEKQMDSESYEWIRMDADFEWLCRMKTHMPSYMHVSQLQQDRDVVAHEDTMRYIRRERPHPVASTFLVKTLMDQRYFHGIRTMAAELLQMQAVEQNEMCGMVQLEQAFRQFFCYPNSSTPRPNDFSNKQQYFIQRTIPQAMSRIRDKRGKCPRRAQQFILEQLLFNVNSENAYSDHFYVAKLIGALADSLIPEQRSEPPMYNASFNDDERDLEERAFLASALEEINRYLRMDEWVNSYHNIWTIAALDAKQKLMRADVIPVDAVDFIQYLQDDNSDEVRIKAFEALVELGFMTEMPIFRGLLYQMGADRSPYVRNRLMKVFCTGLASIAFGDHVKTNPGPESSRRDAEGDEDANLIVVENTNAEIEARRAMFARKQNLPDALAALKREMESNYTGLEKEFQRAVWRAIDSPVLGRVEKITLLELCATMFDEADRWVITLNYPRKWRVTGPTTKQQGKCVVNFKSYYRTSLGEPVALAASPPAHAIPPAASRPLIVSKPPATKHTKPSSATNKPPVPFITPTANGDSIVAQPRRPLPQEPPSPTINGITPTKVTNKRAREVPAERSEPSSPAPVAKRPKLDKAPTSTPSRDEKTRPSRIVTIRHQSLKRPNLVEAYKGGKKRSLADATVDEISVKVKTSAAPSAREWSIESDQPDPPELSSLRAMQRAQAHALAPKPPRKPLPSSAPPSSPGESPGPMAKQSLSPLAGEAAPSGQGEVPGQTQTAKQTPGHGQGQQPRAEGGPPRPKIMLKVKKPAGAG